MEPSEYEWLNARIDTLRTDYEDVYCRIATGLSEMVKAHGDVIAIVARIEAQTDTMLAQWIAHDLRLDSIERAKDGEQAAEQDPVHGGGPDRTGACAPHTPSSPRARG